MIRAVLDTNTIVSGFGWGGPPAAVLDAALDGRFELVTSPALLDELHRVLSYPKLQAVIGDSDELIELLASPPSWSPPPRPSNSCVTPMTTA